MLFLGDSGLSIKRSLASINAQLVIVKEFKSIFELSNLRAGGLVNLSQERGELIIEGEKFIGWKISGISRESESKICPYFIVSDFIKGEKTMLDNSELERECSYIKEELARSKEVLNALGGMPLLVTVELGTIKLSLQDVIEMKPGTIFKFCPSDNKTVTLAMGDISLCEAKFIENDGDLMLEVTKIFSS